jgi:hypothetical protein
MFKPLKNPNVKILAGEPELIGQTGVIFGRDGKLHQVRLNEPVETVAKGLVTTELFETSALRIIRPPVVKQARAIVARDPTDGEVKPVTISAAPVEPSGDTTVAEQLGITDRLPGDALTSAEHEQVYPGGEPIVPVDEPAVEPAVELTKAQKAKARRDAKRAAMENDPALQAARERAEAAVLAQPVEGKGKKGKKAAKVDRGSVIRRKR